MNKEHYLSTMKNIQEHLLEFLTNGSDSEDDFQAFIKLIQKLLIIDKDQCLKEFIIIISKISTYHPRTSNFISKIEKILLFFKDDITHKYPDYILFNIFEENKRMILFLIKEKFIIFDGCVSNYISNTNIFVNRIKYFLPELISYYKKETIEASSSFEKNRKEGENPEYLYKLIRNDSVEDFITYISKMNISLKSNVRLSIFETNPVLIKNGEDIKLIEYAAFYGAIQIFKYLQMNECELRPILWIYAIHSNNPEIINLLEENNVGLGDKTYIQLYKEAIKCFNNQVANYFYQNYLQDSDITFDDQIEILGFYNFEFFPNDTQNNELFSYLCKYDYPILVKILLNDRNIELNSEKNIFNILFLKKIHY